jgi:hypothetical protein
MEAHEVVGNHRIVTLADLARLVVGGDRGCDGTAAWPRTTPEPLGESAEGLRKLKPHHLRQTRQRCSGRPVPRTWRCSLRLATAELRLPKRLYRHLPCGVQESSAARGDQMRYSHRGCAGSAHHLPGEAERFK